MDFKTQLKTWIELVNQTLENYIPEKNTPEKTIYQAMRYSLMAGGKRLRPVLALAVGEMLGGKAEDILPYACAIEMIHTYSLIHDDLPSMDNDDYRRGRLTNHKVYGEATAVLAGDALLNCAFEIMTADALKNNSNLISKMKAMNYIAQASGASGMIGGQVVDLESEGKKISDKVLTYMHRCKTGALIKAPVLAAAALCNADEQSLDKLSNYAENIGLAFQIKDDILDIEGSLESMGKQCGSDAVNEKSTFVTLYGLDESKTMLRETTESAIGSLAFLGDRAGFLIDLARFLIEREN